MSGKEIYSVIAVCGYLRIEKKIYNNWPKVDRNLVGFIASVFGNGEKWFILERINKFCLARNLPVIIINDEKSSTHFKIKIIKP